MREIEILFPGKFRQRIEICEIYQIIYVYKEISTDIYPPKKTLVKFAMCNGSNSHFFTVYPLYFPGCQGILSKVCNCIMVKLCLIYRLDFILSILSDNMDNMDNMDNITQITYLENVYYPDIIRIIQIFELLSKSSYP